MPTVTELAALYFDVNEVEAAMYLLGAAQGGLECVLDRELCANELMYQGPMLKLKECQENTEWLKLCSDRVAEITVKKQAQLIIPVQKKKINIKEENHLKEEKMVVIQPEDKNRQDALMQSKEKQREQAFSADDLTSSSESSDSNPESKEENNKKSDEEMGNQS